MKLDLLLLGRSSREISGRRERRFRINIVL